MTTDAPSPQALDTLRRRWLEAIENHMDAALDLRRRLHQNPRGSGDEEATAATVENALGIELERVAETGRIGRIGPATGPSVLLRAELDALPVHEATGAEYAATSGLMHACGHDVHLAALFAVVRATEGVALPVGLVPVLQPREETYPSGAQDVVASNWLTRHQVGAAIGAHVHPTVPRGAVATGVGVVNAAADEIEIVLCGRGGHGAYPHQASDPVAAISHIVLGLPEIMRRTISPMHPSLLSVGHLQAGERSANVLPSEARLLATLRTTSEEDRVRIQERIRRFVADQAESFGVKAQTIVTSGEPILSNDAALVERMDGWLKRSGIEVTEPMRSLGADDFSFFGEVTPSVMAFVGVEVDDHADPPPLHHPEFWPNENAVRQVAHALVCGYLGAVELFSEGVPAVAEHDGRS